jgi:uncharacterized protein (DUF302 family)
MGTASVGLQSERGLERVESALGFDAAVAEFERLMAGRGLTEFAKIDFTADAKKAGLTMPPMLLIVFGNPKGGTPIMVAAPTSALDLPLKVLISEDAGGKVWLSYNTPEYLAERHGIPGELAKNIAGIRALVKDAAASGWKP